MGTNTAVVWTTTTSVLSQDMSTDTVNAGQFYFSELEGVLQEQTSFGISSIEMLDSTNRNFPCASAKVKLPEGDTVEIVLSNRGFSVCTYSFRLPIYSNLMIISKGQAVKSIAKLSKDC
jgi:hypothetical protein